MIKDLAIMLLTAGIVTVIFKRLNQPLVLGYILAGFLISPYMPWFFTVYDQAGIETWSEIGIIVLMFSLGLEFNLHKLAEVGLTGVITAFTEVAGMLLIGYIVGQALGWSVMDSVFLGGMLSMSSTTIIIKAFDELGLRKADFASLVFGTLVIEDIAGIFMMIVLSTVSVSSGISGLALAKHLGMLVLYLTVWLIAGIYLLPTLLNKAKAFMSDETLLIASLGVCFGMVLLAEALGFSSALGAFLAGSLLAGTTSAERIESLISGVKDLFGAVFFLSVGMMIEPAMIVKYIGPILLISLITVIGKLFCSSLGILFSGNSLENAVHCGCSLAQIGEFAFIIASLGLSLGAIAEYIYPIIISVSVITTLTTPFLIRSGDKIYRFTAKILPASLVSRLSGYSESGEQNFKSSSWGSYLQRYAKTGALYSVIMIGIIVIGKKLLLPLLMRLPLSGSLCTILCLAVIYFLLALFIRPMLDFNSAQYTALWLQSRRNRLPLIALSAMKVAFASVLIFIPMQSVAGISGAWIVAAVGLAVVLVSRSGWMATRYLSVEAKFLSNFNERKLQRQETSDSVEWLDEKLYVFTFQFCGSEKHLKALNWNPLYGVNVIRILHGKKQILMPSPGDRLHPGDLVTVIGEKSGIENLILGEKLSSDYDYPTLRAYTGAEDSDAELFSYALEIRKNSELSGKTIRDCGIRKNYDCMILGLQKNLLPIVSPDVNTILSPGDLVWILGTKETANRLVMDDL